MLKRSFAISFSNQPDPGMCVFEANEFIPFLQRVNLLPHSPQIHGMLAENLKI